MKKILILNTAALCMVLLFTGCSDDEKKESKFAGTWEVTDAMGVEWEEGEGIINTTDPDTEFIGEQFIATSTQITIGTLGTFDYELSNGVLLIDSGDGDIDKFNVEFTGSNKMTWTQDEPEAGDYNEDDKYYQKTFNLERQ